MILRHGLFSDFVQRIKESGKKIIVYGAGMIGQTVAPYWLDQYQLDERVLCYVDADANRQGQMVELASNSIPVMPLTALKKHRGAYVLLVTISAFESAVQALEQMPETEDAEAYFLPLMLLDIAHTPKADGVVRTSGRQLIPKTIHYCWFSGKPIPEPLKKCMESWKKRCPDYEIVRWDEGNYDISWNRYMQQAHARQKWGFIPDVARLDILYRYGGIYLDTDVELLRSLNELLYQPAFCGVEKWGTVNFGGCSGAQAGNPVVKAILDSRKNAAFSDDNGQLNLTTCGYYETIPLIKKGMAVNGKTQRIDGGLLTVYSSDFFHPFDYMSGETKITENTVSIHHFSGSWLGPEAAVERKRTRQKYKQFLSHLT